MAKVITDIIEHVMLHEYGTEDESDSAIEKADLIRVIIGIFDF